jgi:acyl-coenzyme A thioesterase PaaI-like protein
MDDNEALAKRVVDKMYSADEFSKWLGIEFVSVKPSDVVLRRKVALLVTLKCSI